MTSYSIQSGDSLSKIARKFNVSVQDLQRANNIKNPNLIFAGQTLEIPNSNEGGSFDIKGLTIESEKPKGSDKSGDLIETDKPDELTGTDRLGEVREEEVVQGENPITIQSLPQKPKDNLYTYTVQSSESYTDLLKRILIAQGNTNPSKSDIAAMSRQFKADNPNTVKVSGGKEYLLVGKTVKIRADLGDRKNGDEQRIVYENTVVRPLIDYEYTNRYDSKGNLIYQKCEERNPSSGPSLGGNYEHSYTYDSNGRLISDIFDDFEISYKYDSNGNLIEKSTYVKSTGNTNVETRSYDSKGNLVSRTDVHGITHTYNYDKDGRRTSIESPYGDTTYKYDKNNRVSEYTVNDITNNRTITYSYEYSPQGEVESVTIKHNPPDPNFDIKRQYHYNADGKVRQTIVYDSNGDFFGLNILKYDKYGNIQDCYINTTPTGAYGYNYYTGDNPNLINDFSLDLDDFGPGI